MDSLVLVELPYTRIYADHYREKVEGWVPDHDWASDDWYVLKEDGERYDRDCYPEPHRLESPKKLRNRWKAEQKRKTGGRVVHKAPHQARQQFRCRQRR